MTDQELLEKAAKAAGGQFHSGMFREMFSDAWTEWNPLTDDGDALRLAVRLTQRPTNPVSIDISTGLTSVSGWDFDVSEEHGDDPQAATRRAIVRAAASLA